MLIETSEQASDRSAVFVGVDPYEATGGTVSRNLFQGDDRGWLQDLAPLNRLVSEKLQAATEAIEAKAWKWNEVLLDLLYGYSHALRGLNRDRALMTDAEGAAHTKLLAQYLALEGEYAGQNEFPEEMDAFLAQLEARPLIFEKAVIVRAGAFMTLDRYGEFAVYRSYVRPKKEPREVVDVHSGEHLVPKRQEKDASVSGDSNAEGAGRGTEITSGGRALRTELSDDDDDGVLKPLPEQLIMEPKVH